MKFKKEDIIIVTGASSGIGKELAIMLNKQGASVVAVARSKDKLEQLKGAVSTPEQFYVESRDLSENIDELPDFVKQIREKYGKLKALACIAGCINVSTTQMFSKQDIDEVFQLNYVAPMMLTKGFADRRNNVGEGANILFLASVSALYPEKGQSLYAGSKAALIASAKSISKELSPRKIRCNCISPAWVQTPMFASQQVNIGIDTDNYALGIGHTVDVANLAVFLMSDEARWITGANYIMDGGSKW